MPTNGSFAGVHHIFCPTDLTAKSERALRFAGQLARVAGSRLTAFHSAPCSWFRPSLRGDADDARAVKRQIHDDFGTDAEHLELDIIVETGSDPASETIRLARELSVDLLVMKARRGFSSALHFGSIVERVISGARCPVLLFPVAFLAENDPTFDKLNFKRILFDYDFSQATDELFHLTNKLTRNYDAELHVLSVLEPPAVAGVDLAQLENSKSRLGTAVKNRLSTAIRNESRSPIDVAATVEWGSHTDTILNCARAREIDLICTSLPAPSRFVDKIYKLYLGQLLASATCPVLVNQCV